RRHSLLNGRESRLSSSRPAHPSCPASQLALAPPRLTSTPCGTTARAGRAGAFIAPKISSPADELGKPAGAPATTARLSDSPGGAAGAAILQAAQKGVSRHRVRDGRRRLKAGAGGRPD